MNKFEVGKTYTTRSIGDHDCIISATVVSRTAKTIKCLNKHRELATFRVSINYRGDEMFMPWGRGSMMPSLSADDVKAA